MGTFSAGFELHGEGNDEDLQTLRDEILAGLTASTTHCLGSKAEGGVVWSKSVPMRTLYEFNGIDLYEGITNDPLYYLHHNELSLLQKHARQIVQVIAGEDECAPVVESQWRPRCSLNFVDLGAGRIDKAFTLLSAALTLPKFDRESEGRIHYYAIDLQYDPLQSRLKCLSQRLKPVIKGEPATPHRAVFLTGICGSYFKALQTLSNEHTAGHVPNGVKHCYMWLGSSMTNMAPDECVTFLKRLHDDIMRSGDMILVGVDTCQDVHKVMAAYTGVSGNWRKYITNGLANAGRILGGNARAVFGKPGRWEYAARWDAEESRHMRFAKCEVQSQISIGMESNTAETSSTRNIHVEAGEYILMGQSYKHSSQKLKTIFQASGLRIVLSWNGDGDETWLYLLERTTQGTNAFSSTEDTPGLCTPWETSSV